MRLTVTLGRKVEDMSHAKEWRSKLPKAWLANKEYGFDFDEIGFDWMVDVDALPEYELYWFPSSLDAAIELFSEMDKALSQDFMAFTVGKIMFFGEMNFEFGGKDNGM